MKYLFLLLVITQTAFALQFKDGKVILEKLSEYPSCQSKDYSGEWCQAALEDWVKKNPKDAFEAAVMTRKVMNGWAAVPFFHQASTQGKIDCQNKDLKIAVLSALDLPPRQEKVISQARELATKTCPELKTEVQKEMENGGYTFNNMCKEFKLEGEQKAKCDEVKK